jgi:hypothetical protein
LVSDPRWAHDAGRDEEDRKEDQRGQGDLPAQIEHRPQHDEHRDQVAHHVGQEIGEGLLRAEDVVVQAADEGTGLGPGEEGQGHALDVPEHLRAHVEDQTLADDRGDAALGEGEHGVEERQPTGEEGQADDQVGVVPRWMPLSIRALRMSGLTAPMTASRTTTGRNTARIFL